MTKIVAGLIGLGTVGSGVVELLKKQEFIKIKRIAVKDPSKERKEIENCQLSYDIEDIVNDPEIELVIEVAGGVDPIYKYLKQAIQNGKHIVTANKKLLATHGPELFELSKKHNVKLFFEASVAGGIPLISTLQKGLAANEILSVCGILNGTTNFILSKMSREGSCYEDALKEAQTLGLAETDPTDDVEGFDVAYKLCILSALSFGQFIDPKNVRREGISALKIEDVEVARRLNCSLKLVAMGRRESENIDLRVHPVLVPNSHSLSGINGADNAIIIEGSAAGKICLSGPGAGKFPTASAVVGDVITLLKNKDVPSSNEDQTINFTTKKVNKRKKANFGFKNYLRLDLGSDLKPGVLISLLYENAINVIHMEKGEEAHIYTILTDSLCDEEIECFTEVLESAGIKVVSRLRMLEDNNLSLSA